METLQKRLYGVLCCVPHVIFLLDANSVDSCHIMPIMAVHDVLNAFLDQLEKWTTLALIMIIGQDEQ